MKITGQCLCGACSFRVEDDALIDIANCHCTACRRTTGGTFVTWAMVPKKRFRWTGKKPRVFKSSNHARRYFCGRCGAQLAFWTRKSPDAIDLTVATFRNPNRYAPTRHIWVHSRLAWVELGKKLPREQRENIVSADRRLRRKE